MDRESKAYALATAVQLLMGVLVFGTGYALVLFIVRLPAGPLVCGVIGLIHGLAVGISLPLIARYNPAMRTGRVRNPGLLALNYGVTTALGLVLAHVLYGLTYGLIYAGGTTIQLASAWLAGLVATAAMTLFITLGKALRLAAITTIDVIAISLQEILD